MDEKHRANPERDNLEMGTKNGRPAVIRSVRHSPSNQGVGPYRIPAGWGGDDGARLHSGFRVAPEKRTQRGRALRFARQKVTAPVSLLAILWLVLMGFLTLLSAIGGWSFTP
jgi:hypothetical protein